MALLTKQNFIDDSSMKKKKPFRHCHPIRTTIKVSRKKKRKKEETAVIAVITEKKLFFFDSLINKSVNFSVFFYNKWQTDNEVICEFFEETEGIKRKLQ